MIEVVHFTDPGCPWAYSASPFLTALHWRYGEGLRWRHVMIGLAEEGQQYVDRGDTPVRQARSYRSFRARGMPFATQPRDRITGTSPACRALVAIRMHQPDRLFAAFRALQFGWFTTSLLMDDPAAIRVALARVEGLDVEAAVGAIDARDLRAAYEADRAEARSASGTPTEAQGKAATTDGPVRYTARSLLFGTSDGRRLEAGGFQPLEAYDVCVMNLDPTLPRRGVPDDVTEILRAFPDGVTTREVASVLASDNAGPDDAAAEDLLIEAAATGRARREPLGDDALWSPA